MKTNERAKKNVGNRHSKMTAYSQNNDRAEPSTVAGILASTFFFALDLTIVADIIPDIVEHFGAVEKLPWVSGTLLLASAGTINFWQVSLSHFHLISPDFTHRAKMFGQFDPKWLYVLCILGFDIGSAVCGAAPLMNALIIGRAVAGLWLRWNVPRSGNAPLYFHHTCGATCLFCNAWSNIWPWHRVSRIPKAIAWY